MKVFISYSSKHGEWVWDRLVPCLRAGGAGILIDRERFQAGKGVVGQMNATQDKADRHVLVLSPDYLASAYCLHELDRATAFDPHFERGTVIPVLRADCKLPRKITKPLYVDLHDDRKGAQWKKLLDGCGADLACDASEWFRVRDEVRRFLRRDDSVNLVIIGRPKWRELIGNLSSQDDPKGPLPRLSVIDFQAGATASRRGLVTEIIQALGGSIRVPQEPEDLVELDRFIKARGKSYLVLEHFDYAAKRDCYGIDLFATLRDLVTEKKNLVLLIQSRAPLATLLPPDHPMSSPFSSLKTVEFRGSP